VNIAASHAPRYPTLAAFVADKDPEWFKEYPAVDREYIWIYPLAFRPIDGSDLNAPVRTREERDRLTLYVHVPYCRSSCPFCVFMHEVSQSDSFDEYVDCLVEEVSWYGAHPQGRGSDLVAVYLGGGTASLLAPDQIGRLISHIRNTFRCARDLEVSLECHPDVIDKRYLAEVQVAGVNRVSIGLQSFSQSILKAIGRRQSASHAAQMVEFALSLGISTVSVDIMYRVPGQSESDVLHDFERAVALGVQSISAYSLEVSDTRLEQVGRWQSLDLVDRRMFSRIRNYLLEREYSHIAQPDYALPGHENQYLANFWSAPQALNLGIGAGGFSGNFGGHTFCNIHDPKAYKKAVKDGYLPILLAQILDLVEEMARYFVLGVRGLCVPLQPFQNLFGVSAADHYAQAFQRLADLGLTTMEGDVLRLSEEGEYYVDTVSKHFYSPACQGKRVPWGIDLAHLMPNRLARARDAWEFKGE
jgi:oxygen-independent coproporphyrinogen III oxidase